MVGVGFGAVVPNQIGSIIIVLAFTQFIEPIARMAISQVEKIAGAAKFLPGAAGEALAGGSFYGTIAPMGMLSWRAEERRGGREGRARMGAADCAEETEVAGGV